ncbi:VWA domain-containing protein [Candidatus Liberibacter africanus]|nr:Tad domain-containing protein [Candidatus Liberibacter africanus]QTP64441.1 VWA domain-containing protein [Candidatus Liberibacter africanus]
MTAIFIAMFVILISFAIDIANFLYLRSHIQSSIDSAVLSGCTIILSDPNVINIGQQKDKTNKILRNELERHLKPIFLEDARHIANNTNISMLKDPIIPSRYIVKMKSSYQIPDKKFFCKNLIPKNAIELTNISTGILEKPSKMQNVIIKMVLDSSYSMIDQFSNDEIEAKKKPKFVRRLFYNDNKSNHPENILLKLCKSKQYLAGTPNRKVDILIESAWNLITNIQEMQKDTQTIESVYIGFNSYSKKIEQNFVPTLNLNYIKDKLCDINPTGDTNTAIAMENAYNELSEVTNNNLFMDYKKHGTMKKYVIFITDGKNSFEANLNDRKTLATCEQLRKESIKIYCVSVAAPPEGKDLLLKCANSPKNFFIANNGQELLGIFNKIKNMIKEEIVVKIAPNE